MKQLLKCTFLILSLFTVKIFAQNTQITQNIRGIVIDDLSGTPLPFVSIELLEPFELITITDENGQFILENIPVGRYNLLASLEGYEPIISYEIMVSSAKEIYLEIQLKEEVDQQKNVEKIQGIVITAPIRKDQPLNKMTLSGARRFSVEEAARFAGGMDDPARLVSSFAGVSSSLGNNGISIHGNAPSLLQWRLEDIEIPNPNHFADIATLGGGVLSSLSSNVLADSDFFTGAFPSEYNNAVSGVFDMKLRNGNNQKYEHTVQAGILGLDFASEGPLSKKHNSSYLFNYRYSTTGLLDKINSGDETEQQLDYQDLNFKLNFPTKKAGTFSIWGTALIDKFRTELDDVEDRKYKDDSKLSRMKQTSSAGGLSHRYFFKDNSLLKTTLAITYSKTDAWEDMYDLNSNSTPYLDFINRYTNLVLTSSFNKKYNSVHTNKTGFSITNMNYDMNLALAPFYTEPLEKISEGKGDTRLISAYTSSLFIVNDRITATAGINGQLLTLNNKWTIELRASVKWKSSPKSFLALAYGLHSRMEKMDVYFVKKAGNMVNKNLDFTKAHHINLSYNYKIRNDMNLKIEPYFQYLYHVPVIADSTYSVLNRNTFYVEDPLINKGRGRNYGVDITFEKYLKQGIYYMATASIFNSEYRGGDGVWQDTRFNRNFIINGLVGKEWMLGRNKQNILSVNLKLTLQGGDRYSPVDEEATMKHPDKKTQYDETKAFSKQFSPIFLANYTISYKMNKKKVTHEFALKSINATNYKEYYGHEYNLKTNKIEPNRQKTSLFNLSYKLDF